jgi:hypothetical protein
VARERGVSEEPEGEEPLPAAAATVTATAFFGIIALLESAGVLLGEAALAKEIDVGGP